MQNPLWVAQVQQPAAGYILDENFTGAAGTLPNPATWNVITGAGAPNYGANNSEFYVNSTSILYQDGSPQGNLVFVLGTAGTHGASAGTWPSGRCSTDGGSGSPAGANTTPRVAVAPGQSCEIRAKIFPLAGAWPACWFLGVASTYLTASYAEIDMQESGDDAGGSYIYSTEDMWGCNSSGQWQFSGVSGGTAAPPLFAVNDGNYHVYRLDLTTNNIAIYIDGTLNYNLTSAQAATNIAAQGQGAIPWPFNNAEGLYVILNVAVDTTDYGTPSAAALPAEIMAVDYVRIWAPAGPDPNTP